MKRLSAIILSAFLLIALALSAGAFADLEDVQRVGYTAYPLFDETGAFTDGVSFFGRGGNQLTEDDVKACLGKQWDQNCIRDKDGTIEMIIWSNANHTAFGQGIRLANLTGGSATVKVVFTGTAIRFGTTYRTMGGTFEGNAAKIVIDGKEVETDPDLLHPDWADDTEPTIIFQKEDLENTTHTVEISAAVGDFEFDWFEVRGTIGDDTAGDPNNGDWPEETEPPTTEPKPTEPAKTEPPKTDPPKTSAPATSAPVTSAPAPSGNNGLSTGAIIGIIVAAVAVIAVVVIVVVKGKKK